MASVFKRGKRWYVHFKSASGRWVRQVTDAKTKTEVRRLADDEARKTDRQRRGLEPLPDDSNETLDDLCAWWLENRCPSASRYREEKRLQLHVKGSTLGRRQARAVTSVAIEQHLASMEKAGAAPASLNKLRAILGCVFSRAIRAGVCTGPNPVASVERRKVPHRSYVTLRAEEIPLVLEQLPAQWRDLMSVALWTGMRKGELLGLRKRDVNFEDKEILVARSYNQETTKGGHHDIIPIADAIVPVLRRAVGKSPSELVFPRSDGSMHRADVDLPNVLRAALSRAGLVDGYEHVCRRCKARGEPHTQRAADSGHRRCPRCNMILWPRAIPRRIRFHDLRHCAATLMLRAGVDLHRVQRLLRHSDPRITATIYSHLLAGDLRAGVNAIAPQVVLPEPPKEERRLALKVAANSPPFIPSLSQNPEKRSRLRAAEERISNRDAELEQRARRESNPRPSDSKSAGKAVQRLPAVRSRVVPFVKRPARVSSRPKQCAFVAAILVQAWSTVKVPAQR